MNEKTCEYCGNPCVKRKLESANRWADRKYCSVDCMVALRNEHRTTQRRVDRTCECGKPTGAYVHFYILGREEDRISTGLDVCPDCYEMMIREDKGV